jgi:hypothetical protein
VYNIYSQQLVPTTIRSYVERNEQMFGVNVGRLVFIHKLELICDRLTYLIVFIILVEFMVVREGEEN